MKIYSWNVNGIRSSWAKGLRDFMINEQPDILCLQEIKAVASQFPGELSEKNLFSSPEYYIYTNAAAKAGYSGVSILSKVEGKLVSDKLGHERFDSEGRFLEVSFGDFTLINLYLPHGGRNKENLDYKIEVYNLLIEKFQDIKNKKVLLCGDFNIAHDERDLARPKENTKNIMFTPEERALLDIIANLGYVDTLRLFEEKNGLYSWFPYMANAKERNLGWRIDYIWASNLLKPIVCRAGINKALTGSDHVPIYIEFK